MPIKIDRNVLFPINQHEQAKQGNANYLLAQDVFEKIAGLIERGLEKIKRLESQPGGLDDLDQHRGHEAILLQGARGTGKSAVLVNLAMYLSERADFANELLILKPIDPTLLENGENMFLDVFIAALVRDAQVKAKLDQGGREAEAFYDQLCKVGSALESAQTQKEQHGMDRVRALIGGNGIAEQVHKLFQCALRLTGKKLIILQIDDVDTALQHAYEKIEIVRKYLVSPVVVPLICGDIELYNDVIWRDIHGRLLEDSNAEEGEAKERAKDLSIAYQRKILPLPRRIDVPQLQSYLNANTIKLVQNNGEPLFSFPVFKYWLEAVLNERVNGVENSYLHLPIETVREFAQLVSHMQGLIPALHTKLTALGIGSHIEIRRLSVMKPAVAACVANFSKEYNDVVAHEKKTDRTIARAQTKTNFKNAVEKLPADAGDGLRNIASEWQQGLKSYFRHHQNGGAVYLTLVANDHFRACKAGLPAYRSIFDTNLFRPRQHKGYSQFAQSAEIKEEWRTHLESRMPGVWTKNFPATSILAYPRPEIGRQILNSEKAFTDNDFSDIADAENAEIVRRLMTHYNFYNKTNRTTLTLTGRIFELLITTLIRDISEREVLNLMYRAPFYSVAEMVNTKTFDLSGEDEPQNDDDSNDDGHVVGDTLTQLVKDINDWRKENAADLAAPPHAWLIYNVTNKYFNQANYFNMPTTKVGANQKEGGLLDVVGTALQAFNAIWAIFGSFEKGSIFGFDEVIAYMNVSEADKDFSKNQLYRQNILPFLWEEDVKKKGRSPFFNFRTGAYTYLLASHPLKALFEKTYNAMNTRYLGNAETAGDTDGLANEAEKLILSDADRVDFNTALMYALRKDEAKGPWNKKAIAAASLKTLEDVIECFRNEFESNETLKYYLDNILKMEPAYAGSSLGIVQTIMRRINEIQAASQAT